MYKCKFSSWQKWYLNKGRNGLEIIHWKLVMGYPFGKYEFRKVPDTLRTNKTQVFLPLNELNMVFKFKNIRRKWEDKGDCNGGSTSSILRSGPLV